jgi:hypothetical protein
MGADEAGGGGGRGVLPNPGLISREEWDKKSGLVYDVYLLLHTDEGAYALVAQFRTTRNGVDAWNALRRKYDHMKTIIESAEPVGVVMHDAYPKNWVHGVAPSVGEAGEPEVAMECRVEGLQDADTVEARSNILFPIQAYCSRRLHDEKHAVK